MSNVWGTDSGLADDYTGTIEDNWFGIDNRFGGSLLKYFRIRLDDPSIAPNAEDGCVREQYTCGEEWESVDGGVTAQRKDGSDKRFHSNSQYGMWINKCLELGMGDVLSERGTPQESKVWNGLRVHMKAHEKAYSFKNEAGEKVEGVSRRMWPVEYLGEGDGAGGSASGGKNPSLDLDALNIDPDTRTELIKVANDASTHDGFVDAALALTGVQGNDKLVLALANPSAWEELKSI